MLNRVLGCLMAALLSLPMTAQAYEVGDQVDPQALAQLQVDPEKLTIVDFFAEWCVSCRIELPIISNLAKQLDARAIEIVGVDVDEDIEVAKAFQAEFDNIGGLSFRVVNDPSQFLIGKFEPIGMPAMYYIYQGQVVKIHMGAIQNVDKVILQDLQEFGLY